MPEMKSKFAHELFSVVFWEERKDKEIAKHTLAKSTLSTSYQSLIQKPI